MGDSRIGGAPGAPGEPVEYEYQFPLADAAHEKRIKDKLKKLGAVRVGEFLMYITVYNAPAGTDDKPDEPRYIRIRQEAPDLATYTVKSGPMTFRVEREIELTPENATKLHDMMTLGLGMTVKYRTEKMREIWTLPDDSNVKEVVFDWLPGLPKYMEIDAHTEKALRDTAAALGFKESDRIPEKTDGYKHFYGVPTTAEGRKLPPGASLIFAPSAIDQFTEYLGASQTKKFNDILAKQIAHADTLR